MKIYITYRTMEAFENAEMNLINQLDEFDEETGSLPPDWDRERMSVNEATAGAVNTDDHHDLTVHVDGYVQGISEDEIVIHTDVSGGGDEVFFRLPGNDVSEVTIGGFVGLSGRKRRRRRKNPPPTLQEASIEELREIARTYGVMDRGTREHLIGRIAGYEKRSSLRKKRKRPR